MNTRTFCLILALRDVSSRCSAYEGMSRAQIAAAHRQIRKQDGRRWSESLLRVFAAGSSIWPQLFGK